MVVILRTKPQPFQSVQLVEPEFDDMSDAEFYAHLEAGIELPTVYIKRQTVTYMDMICDIARETNSGDPDELPRIEDCHRQFPTTPIAYIWIDVVMERNRQNGRARFVGLTIDQQMEQVLGREGGYND